MSNDSPLQSNPLIEKLRIPGETFRLPSHGLFYDNGELDPSVKNGEIEVYPMTAIDEIVLSTPDKLLSGKAITEVFSRRIPQVLKPHELLAKDVDFLMVCLRMVSFGPVMEVLYNHHCMEGSLEHTYKVNLQKIIASAKAIDPTTVAQEYAIEFSNGQKALLKPITYGDIIDIYQSTMMQKTESMSEEDAEKLIIGTITSVIKSVDGITDKNLIEDWVKSIRLGWKRQIQETIQSVSDWGIDLKSEQICNDCKQQVVLQVSANPVSFFT